MDFSAIGNELQQSLQELLLGFSMGKMAILAFFLIAGVVLLKIVNFIMGKIFKGRISEQSLMLVKKSVHYLGFTLISILAFDALGFNVSTILGVAGLAGIAVGFAAQTAISNIISGFFLISEKPFAIDDVITTNEVTGVVLSIDMLSVKIRTFDNLFVRIPNELIIKSKVYNVTRYPIRRMDITVSVSYSDMLPKVLGILKEVAEANYYALRNPEALILVKTFDTSGISILLGVWFEKSEYVAAKNSLMVELQAAFAAQGITIPYPHMQVHIKEGNT